MTRGEGAGVQLALTGPDSWALICRVCRRPLLSLAVIPDLP